MISIKEHVDGMNSYHMLWNEGLGETSKLGVHN